MILLIDNYDSFTYNLYQMLGALLAKTSAPQTIRVVRNDGISVEKIGLLAPTHVVLSPGPGRPEDAGICPELIRQYASGTVLPPLLGVCLGHQAICQAFGATITYAERLMHGKSSLLHLDTDARLFAGLPPRIRAARYHSLAADPSTIPEDLRVTARTEAGEVMAVEHRFLPLFGLQFHPESILTPEGWAILANFLRVGEASVAGERRGEEVQPEAVGSGEGREEEARPYPPIMKGDEDDN
jgi:anthranilate synthase component 2